MYALVTASGAAALAWEVLWQIRASLALGVSAGGTALTLAAAMGGMSVGAIFCGRRARAWTGVEAMRAFAVVQLLIGLAGIWLGPAFRALEWLDTRFYERAPALCAAATWSGSLIAIGVPAALMGATLPMLGVAAGAWKAPLSRLYGFNTLGAAAGALSASFIVLPVLGLFRTGLATAGVNWGVAVLAALVFGRGCSVAAVAEPAEKLVPAPSPPVSAAAALAAVTGFSTFALEVAWFRAMMSAFKVTSDAFAVLLATVLVALGAAATLAARVRRAGWGVGIALVVAGVLALLATPLIERFDLLTSSRAEAPWRLVARWFGLAVGTIGPPMFTLGLVLPCLLDERRTAREWGLVYGVNTLAAVGGALGAGWVMLPSFGVARTAWTAGGALVVAGLWATPRGKRAARLAAGALALVFAATFESRLGADRVQLGMPDGPWRPARVLAVHDGPDATYAAVETVGGHRVLVINGFMASGQFGAPTESYDPTHYMRWMGHLPMVLHPAPRCALVICFGIGLTANAVRRERPEHMDVVELSREVLDMADLFPANEDVLHDPIVRAHVMDGRAFVRRTRNIYDVITLEPMPPNFSGMNALYSREFYEACRQRLGEAGLCAQWLPLHLTPVQSSRDIVQTFLDVFPNAMLWQDPLSGTAILVGAAGGERPVGREWPGYARPGIERSLSEERARAAVLLDAAGLARFAAGGRVIRDDNQLLAFGPAVIESHRHLRRLREENFAALAAAGARAMPPSANDFRLDAAPPLTPSLGPMLP